MMKDNQNRLKVMITEIMEVSKAVAT